MVLNAKENDRSDSPPKLKKLSFYNEDDKVQELPPPKPAFLESHIRNTRLRILGVWNNVQAVNSNISNKWLTAKSHTLGVVEFLQNEPAIWQRCAIVGVAGLTGLISGYRRSVLIKIRNTTLLAGVAATICWPKETVSVTSKGYKIVKKPFDGLWEEYSPWSTERSPITPATSTKRDITEDMGQSLPEDKDMYSTRE